MPGRDEVAPRAVGREDAGRHQLDDVLAGPADPLSSPTQSGIASRAANSSSSCHSQVRSGWVTRSRSQSVAFDQDSFADDMERATRGSDSVIGLVQGMTNTLAGMVNLLAVTV